MNTISDFTGAVSSYHPVSGGCICKSYCVEAEKGKFFIKTGENYPKMFQREAEGLDELAKAEAINTPKVLAVKETFLLLEWFDSKKGSLEDYYDFGKSLAELHRYNSDEFGFYQNNYLGRTQQINTWKKSWSEFYFINRLKFQVDLAYKNFNLNSDLRNLFKDLEKNFSKIIDGSEEKPCLIHGDLWSGNYMITDSGACIYDPAAYYGHRELEIAMTYLFGGFPNSFYQGYQSEYPLPDGHEERLEFYQLYHLLNHLNLFGESYYHQVVKIMRKYV